MGTNITTRIILTTLKPNKTEENDIVKDSFDFKRNPGLVFLLVACVFTGLWMLFLTFYNSRLLAFVITKLLRKFVLKEGYLEIGSLSFSILSGKLMFRDVKFITKDLNIQIVDGLAIFRWWLVYRSPDSNYYKETLRDKGKLEHGICRLVLQLNGFEFHLFNRSDLYKKIQDILKCERYGDARKSVQSLDALDQNAKDEKNDDNLTYNIWKELLPVIRINIRSGKLAIGNRLLENTFWIHFNTANVTYSMPDAPCSLDYFTHFVYGQCSDIRMLLSRSPGYKGKCSEPPRWMGHGYTLLQSGEVKVTYYQDVPGLVPVETNGDPESDPMWGLDVVFTKRVEINYGPWADLQRDALQKYFLPNDFQEVPVTKPLEAEQRRLHTGLDVNIEFTEGASIEILFTQNEETVAIHILCGDQNKEGEKPSSVHFYQPWTVNEYGYTTNIVARLQQVEATTSLKFQKFLESDLIEVAVNMTIPRMWNHFQHWTCELCLVKTTCYFIWEHVDYITDLINEWSVSTPPDIASFVPYEWEFSFFLRDFELIVLVNEFNWMDCMNEDENGELAFCGETLDINFILPFTHFQPEKSEMKFFFRGETIMLRSFIPESNTIHRSIISLARNSDCHMYPKSNARPMSTTDYDQTDGPDMYDEVDSGVSLEDQICKGWRRRTAGTSAWIDVWSVPVIILNLFYKYHLIPAENEETRRINQQCNLNKNAQEPLDLFPDIFTIELEAGPSALRLFGSFWRQFFLGFKENYFGLFQDLNEFNTNREIRFSTSTETCSTVDEVQKSDDMRHYRPLEVNLTIVLLDLQAELTMHTAVDVPSPQAYSDRLTFEMHKTYQETRLQLIVSPVSIIIQEQVKWPSEQAHLSKGFLTLSGLQFRGHAMFSDKDVPLGNDTIEYAWLVEVQCGHLKGKITPSQMQMLAAWADTFILHLTDEENVFLDPDPVVKCHHNVHQTDCKKSPKDGSLCPTEDSVKYKMVRISIESVNIFLTEMECAMNLQASPIRFASCNSKNEKITEGGSLFINEIYLRQFIQQINFNYVESVKPTYTPTHSNNWIEVGVFGLGPLTVDIQESASSETMYRRQLQFLTYHDKRTKRLWFIWNVEELYGKLAVDRRKHKICGCVGGCNFFGKNNNGVRFFTNQSLDASSGVYNRYGSESLWGGGHGELGNNVKEHLLRRSGYLSNSPSMVDSVGKLSANVQQSRGASFNSKIFGSGMDSVDQSARSLSFISQLRRASSIGQRETDSKLGFGRSRSVVDGDSIRLPELHSADSESTFYSCNSEQELSDQKTSLFSRRSGSKKTPSRASLKSNASSASYVSAVSSSGDLLEGEDTVDNVPFEHVSMRPLVEPGLLAAYSSHMQQVKCINWRQSIPAGLRKKFSLLKNLKVIIPPGHRSPLPSIPNFSPNLQGKLPFNLQTSSHDLSAKQNANGDPSTESTNRDKNDSKKSVITMKFHQQVTLMVTPLLTQAIERFVSSLKPLSNAYHLCHLLDSLHHKCICMSKQKFKEHNLLDIISKHDKDDVDHLIKSQTTNKKTAFNVLLPELKLLFFQISGERYTPSEQSSLSAKCGSEYSYDLDIKDTDSSLLAAMVTNLKFKAYVNSDDPAMFQCASKICQKFGVVNSLTSNDMNITNIKNRNISDYSIFSGSLESIKMQLLHLEGTSEKESKITEIPREKTRLNFLVKQGGNLYADNVSVLDSGNREELGNIIFEAGMEDLTLSGSLLKELNKHFFEEEVGVSEENLKRTNSTKSRKTSVRNQSPSRSSSRKRSKDECFESEPLFYDEKDSIPMRILNKSNNYEPLESDSTLSSNASFAYKSSTRKGYVALDIDPGEAADESDVEDEEEGLSSLFSGSEHNSQTSPSRQTSSSNMKRPTNLSTSKKEINHKNPIIKKSVTGGINIGKIWVNLAAPRHLQNYYSKNEQDVNLVTVLVPAASCWLPPTIDCMKTIEDLADHSKIWKYSVLAALMGQAMPDPGRLMKKNQISAAATKLSRFLQEECSSQLINAFRRQTSGHRLFNLCQALENGKTTPPKTVLEKGIYALARHWKTVIVGAEGLQTGLFASTQQAKIKKPVVGRGDLPPDALKFLMKANESESESQIPTNVEDVEAGNLCASGDKHHSDQHLEATHTEADVLLNTTSESDEENEDITHHKHRRRYKHAKKKEETLYDYFAKSPASSSAVQSPTNEERFVPTVSVINEPDSTSHETSKNDRSTELTMLRSPSQMVSVPTSGMQLAEAAEVFSTILTSVGIRSMNDELDFLTESSYRGAGNLETFEVTLLTSASTVDDSKKVNPIFVLKNTQILLNGTQKPIIWLAPHPEKQLSTDIVFSVNIENIFQHVNFALVRLILQVIETSDVIKEEEKFATKVKHDKKEEKNFDWILKSPLSSPGMATPKCWRNMFNIMSLYAAQPEMMKTLSKQSGIQSPSSIPKGDIMRAGNVLLSITEQNIDPHPTAPPLSTNKPRDTAAKPSTTMESQQNISEQSGVKKLLSITGTASLKKAEITASISGLELNFEMRNLNGSFFKHKQSSVIETSSKSQAPSNKLMISIHLDRLKINVIESVKALRDSSSHIDEQPELKITRTLLVCKIYKSHALHSNFGKSDNAKGNQHSLLAIGPIAVDIPQHPGSLRSTVTQFTKRLQKHFIEFDDYRMSRREMNDTPITTNTNDITSMKDSLASISTSASFRVVSNSILISAALLPSLRVEYKIEQINAWGNLSSKARFFCRIPQHVISFNTKVHVVPLPATTHIDLPPIKIEGHYLEIFQESTWMGDYETPPPPTNGRNHHGYLSVSVHIGSLEQNLTTDLLNHMIFFQKGFVKEINEVVEVVDSTEQVPLRRSRSNVGNENITNGGVPMLYAVKIILEGIQITATTPSCTGIRLKTGEVNIEITNKRPSFSVLTIPYNPVKVYGQAQVDINVALGYFNKNSFFNNENFSSVYANFDTSLGISNALQGKEESSMDKETILVTLSNPQLFVMPTAVDKGVLVYLHYKNAYEYWMEQRIVLKAEFPAVAEHILNKIPQQPNYDLSSFVILQVTVNGLGVCLPIKEAQAQNANSNFVNMQNNFADTDPGPALLVTAVEASVTCCSSGAFVSTGHFKKFCLRLADNFNHMEETWNIDEQDMMNTYTIPEGTYKLCSRTITPGNPIEEQRPGKWVMSVFWKMCGVEIHLDTNIGKRLKLLTKALTTLTGESDVADISSVAEDFETLKERTGDHVDGAIAEDVVDGEPKKNKPVYRSLWEEDSLEKQLLLQTRTVNQLRRNDAHPDIIKREVKQLQEIENALSKEFFKDVKKRFRRKKRRSTMEGSVRRKSFHRHSALFLEPKITPQRMQRSYSHGSRDHASLSSRTQSLVESTVGDEVDGPFVETIDYDPSPIKNVEINVEEHEVFPPKTPTQVKFSESTQDVRSETSDTNRSTLLTVSEALDFEFNMLIDIESGKCTLHSNTESNGENGQGKDTTDNSASGKSRRISEPHNNEQPQRHRALRPMRSAGNILNTSGHGVEQTLLLIPGIKVRLYYLSKFTSDILKDAELSENLSVGGTSVNKPLLSKSATLNASVEVESISKETMVKPSLLDYLEKAFEPIIMDSGNNADDTVTSVDNDSNVGTGSMLSSSGTSLYSFPVDVVVLIRVQPSDIRFSCFPVSKVECLLRIPSLDFAITSTPPTASSSSGPMRKKSGRGRLSTSSNLSTETGELKSGMGFTACLAKFSLCIFHPYGKQYSSGADSRMGSGISDRRKSSRSARSQQISGGKDSLSLNVEFIKFTLSRSTVKNLEDQKTSVQISTICDIGSAAFNYDMRRLNEILDVPKAWYKRSLMQRLFLGKEGAYATQNSMNQSNKTPAEAQPKPVIETTVPVVPLGTPETPRMNRITKQQPGEKRTPVLTHRRAVSSGTTFLSNLITSPFPAPKSAATPRNDGMYLFDFISNKESKTLNESSSSISEGEFDVVDGREDVSNTPLAEWETKVVVTFNVARVDVSTNMGNVMGQALWSTNDLKTNASITLNNIGVSTASIDLSVRQGLLDAHGGVISAYVELHEIAVDGKFVENFGSTPFHCATIGMRDGELRLDYMGSSIVMASLSSFNCKLEDHWLIPGHFTEQNSSDSGRSGLSHKSSLSSSPRQQEFKSCEIYINCDTRWDEAQLIISRSTATDLSKMMIKLQDFLDQQHRSGIRALNTLYSPGGYFSPMPMATIEDNDESSIENESLLKYQHWIELINGLYGLQLNNLPARIPDKNVVLGGRLSLYGNFASLACFHGANFRTQNWGLFTVREPGLQFTSETRVVEKSCQVMRAACVHDVSFFLGKSEKRITAERRKSAVNMYDFMATVRRVSRGRRNPPGLSASIQEWLIFVNTTSDDEIPSKFSSSQKEEVSEKYSHTKGQGGSRKVSFAPKFRYENESAVILALPRVHVQLTTEHDQPMSSTISKKLAYNSKRGSRLDFPTAQGVHYVDMSFLSTFEDSIHVTMDMTMLFYLHDLILSYMKEQETSLISSTRHQRSSSMMERDGGESLEPTVTKTEQAIKKEEKFREFRVKNWKLDPTIALLSWAGKRMDPVSIDWVLEKLGFAHANMTIPKWIQRGALDPMDYTLAVVMGHLLVNMKVHEDKK